MPVLVAVSGGADSVALLTALVRLQGTRSQATRLQATGKSTLVVGHYNHGWRGVESDEEAKFVRELAKQYGIDFELACAPRNTAESTVNEASAREARYGFLRQTAEQRGARYIATAHTADDQAETVLHRILRGTGIAGLAGIPRTRVLSPAVTLIRPLLPFRRTEIEAYLAELNQPYREDSSNRDTRFTRNRIRQELIPQLANDYNPEVTPALLRLSELAEETQQYLVQQVEPMFSSCIVQQDSIQTVVSRKQLASHPPLLIREFFVALWTGHDWPRQAMGYREWERLSALVAGGDGDKLVLPGGIHCENRDAETVITRKST